MSAQENFTLQSAQGTFTVDDKHNGMTWGPFPSETEAGHQIRKLEHLAELQTVLMRVIRLEETIWDEITLETDASREAKQLEADLQKMVDAHLDALKKEQAARK